VMALSGRNVIGLDDTSLFGQPSMVKGNIQDIFAENAFIAIQDAEFSKLKNPQIGTEFELNDHRGIIVGIARVASSALFGVPTLYTTYSRGLAIHPEFSLTMSYYSLNPNRWRMSRPSRRRWLRQAISH